MVCALMNHGFRIEELHREGSVATLSIDVSTETDCTDGHFPGDPMVPAVSILLEMVGRAATSVFSLGASRGLRRVKFMAAIRPGDQLRLDLTREDQSVRFQLTREEALVSRGALLFAERS